MNADVRIGVGLYSHPTFANLRRGLGNAAMLAHVTSPTMSPRPAHHRVRTRTTTRRAENASNLYKLTPIHPRYARPVRPLHRITERKPVQPVQTSANAPTTADHSTSW
jgi:hypothetical protein